MTSHGRCPFVCSVTGRGEPGRRYLGTLLERVCEPVFSVTVVAGIIAVARHVPFRVPFRRLCPWPFRNQRVLKALLAIVMREASVGTWCLSYGHLAFTL